jgi:hypothetical protein
MTVGADNTYPAFGCMGFTRKTSPNFFISVFDNVLLSMLSLRPNSTSTGLLAVNVEIPVYLFLLAYVVKLSFSELSVVQVDQVPKRLFLDAVHSH